MMWFSVRGSDKERFASDDLSEDDIVVRDMVSALESSFLLPAPAMLDDRYLCTEYVTEVDFENREVSASLEVIILYMDNLTSGSELPRISEVVEGIHRINEEKVRKVSSVYAALDSDLYGYKMQLPEDLSQDDMEDALTNMIYDRYSSMLSVDICEFVTSVLVKSELPFQYDIFTEDAEADDFSKKIFYNPKRKVLFPEIYDDPDVVVDACFSGILSGTPMKDLLYWGGRSARVVVDMVKHMEVI